MTMARPSSDDLPADPGCRGAVVLESPAFRVTCDAGRPVVLSLEARRSGDRLFGDPAGDGPVFTVAAEAQGRTWVSTEDGAAVAYDVRRLGTAVCYHARVTLGTAAAVELDLVFELAGNELTLSLGGVQEAAGFRLLHVDVRRLVSAHARQGAARMVIGSGAGRIVDPARCGEGEHFHKYNWIRDCFGTVGLVYHTDLTAVLRLDSLDDTVLSSVASGPDGRFAGLGARLLVRYPSAVAGASFAPHAATAVHLRLIDEPTGSPERGWVVGARHLQGRVTSRASPLYRGAFIYKIFIGCPDRPHETSFDEALTLIRKIHRLTDGARQIAYLVGFQHQGHDTGYPDVFTVNETAGGMDRLRRLMAEAPGLNANVSFHDNYDDAYDNSPAWDPADISVDREGGLLKGGVWNGVQAYWIAMPFYVRTKALERLRRTLAQYPIRETYHLDVLTASVFRLDYRAAGPTGKDADWRARVALVEAFRGRGIDVTSEGCGLPFLDHIAYFWNLPRPKEPVFHGDRPIPFGPFIAHGHVNYGGSSPRDGALVLDGLLYGAFYSQDLTAATPLKEILDAFYLFQVPLDPVRAELMIDYAEDGTRKQVIYADGSVVSVDFESLDHEVCVRGRRVLRNWACFAPGSRPGTYLFYRARDEDNTVWPLPPEWAGAAGVAAVALTEAGEGERHELAVKDGSVSFDLPTDVPFRVTRLA